MSIRFNLTAALACQAKRRPDVFALCTGGAELGYGGLVRQRIGWPGISRELRAPPRWILGSPGLGLVGLPALTSHFSEDSRLIAAI